MQQVERRPLLLREFSGNTEWPLQNSGRIRLDREFCQSRALISHCQVMSERMVAALAEPAELTDVTE
jgi:hypothetical protein